MFGITTRDRKALRFLVGRNLAAARNNMGLTQSQAARKTHGYFKRDDISKIENGKRDISVHELIMLQKIYQCSLDYVFGLSIEPEIEHIPQTTNFVLSQVRNITETLVESIADNVFRNIRPLYKDNGVALIEQAKKLAFIVVGNDTAMRDAAMRDATSDLLGLIREIERLQAKQAMQIEQAVIDVHDRLDTDDKHILLKDIEQEIQLPLALSEVMGYE